MTNTPEKGRYVPGLEGPRWPPDHLPKCPLLGLRKSNFHSPLSGLLAADSGQWGFPEKGRGDPAGTLDLPLACASG